MCNACGIYLKTHGRNRPVDGQAGLGARTGFPLKRVCQSSHLHYHQDVSL